MPQIQCPIDYVPLQQVTAANLNAHVNSATIVPGIITDQTNLAANTVASGDSVLLYDLSATALREATAGDLLGSNLPVTTSTITAGANSDVVITPYDGVVVTGSTYVSADAITVTVTTAVAHGLSVNQVVQIYGAGTGYNGVFKITAVTSLTFTYVISSLYSSSASITITPTLCSYYTKGTNRISGHSTVSGNQYSGGVVTSYLEVNTQALFNTIGGANTNVTGTLTASTVPTSGGHLTNKTYVDGTVSKTANGYVTMPNGLIIQWGTHLTAMANYSVATVTFPIPFPTACFTVQLTARAVTAVGGGATLENGIKLNGVPTTTTFGVYVNWSGSAAGATIYPTWIAIGH